MDAHRADGGIAAKYRQTTGIFKITGYGNPSVSFADSSLYTREVDAHRADGGIAAKYRQTTGIFKITGYGNPSVSCADTSLIRGSHSV